MFRITSLRRLRPDLYVLALLSTVAVAALIPASGPVAVIADGAGDVAIGLLFFLYGARLSTKAVLDGLRHWRLHSMVLLSTFAFFPLLGIMAGALVPTVLPATLYTGLLFLCTLPSTVQSSIAFTSTAGGNVAAAICSASMSNMLGVMLTPLLVTMLVSGGGGGFNAQSVLGLVVQLILPFVAGQIARRWIGDWMERNRGVLGHYERGSILLVVYIAFSASVTAGIWQQVTPVQLACLFAVIAVLLTVALVFLSIGARGLGFPREDRSAILFCGSVKSLASGLPIANVLFPSHQVGFVVLPVMLYHLLQLIVCAALARRRSAATPPRSEQLEAVTAGSSSLASR
jgi:sodium/bile acid cotransporter 7